MKDHKEPIRTVMDSEELRYTLSLGGKLVGEQLWKTTPDRHHWITRVQTDFVSTFVGGGRRVQISKLHPKSLVSAGYFETAEGGGKGRSSYETLFDRKLGLVIVRQARDEAVIPLVRDYQDPVSLLQLLRRLPDEAKHVHVPMVGSDAHIQRLPDQILEFKSGPVSTRVFQLLPGKAVVHLETEAPFRLVRFFQPVDDLGTLEANLWELQNPVRKKAEEKIPLEDKSKRRSRKR